MNESMLIGEYASQALTRCEMKNHNWVLDDEQKAAYASYYHCTWCGAHRHYTWMPGWPGSYTYFTSNGRYSGPEGTVDPECNDGPLLSRISGGAAPAAR